MKKLIEKVSEFSTVAIIGMLLIGVTGTAALLDTYGEAEGTADVSQAVTLDGTSFNSNSDSAEVTFDYTGQAGTLEEETFPVQNNADRLAETTFSATAAAEGIDPYHVVTDQWNVDGDSFDVSVSIDESDSSKFALEFDSSEKETSDYARVFYPVSQDFNGTSELTYEGEKEGGNPLDDEVWVVTEDGEQYFAKGASSTTENGELTTVTYDLDEKTWYNLTRNEETPTWDEVVAIGIGQGAPYVGGYTVDTRIDDIKLGGSSIDENPSLTLDLLPTGTADGVETRYQAHLVSDFHVALEPQEYTVESTVSPVTSK